MSSSNNRRPRLVRGTTPNKIWCWRRRVRRADEANWTERLRKTGCASWAFSETPGRQTILLTSYPKSRAAAQRLIREFGGRAQIHRPEEWLTQRHTHPLKVGTTLEIVHEKPRRRKVGEIPTLCIPHGLAFGSGEHATTLMLLRALVAHPMAPRCRVLDLGTGSGILALTARMRGAKTIVATDFDPDAIRTARRNEEMNFCAPLVRWRVADVRRLRAHRRYDLVLANLFSGILCEAAKRIAASVAPGGEVWLSGILRNQQEEVMRAFVSQGLHFEKATSRGKWVMLRWAAPTN